ncbi:LAMI_0F04412g1_1 [Lachancea mirantina]|uniref:Serine/threonine-protein phosphatase 2A activator n=1 Tax=Lachancea mirantina TaxID=1230905 RepID=A0A1G4JY02_9SACH|nr:LAMI_0F04412g1_1 [Lachancea mirantina]
MRPETRLVSPDDLELWQTSKCFDDLVYFIEHLAHAVEGHENSDYEQPIGSNVSSVNDLLGEIEQIIKAHPVVQDAGSTRFGKIEFRDFYQEVSERTPDLIKTHFSGLSDEQTEEVSAYLIESWGNSSRIDYGSGHELNFVCFLYVLQEFGVLKINDSRNIVLILFRRYLKIMRELETLYWLEPAGSHGVWGLDDYHFLPFLFGAFQLAPHKYLKPKSIHNRETIEMFADRYLYFGCIDFINSVKTTAALRWHSPMLDDISGVKKWSKVAEGMIKMYKAEVLKKLPIMQHFLFGDVLKCPTGVSGKGAVHEHENGMACNDHLHNTWGDCCGIRVPSAVAASTAQKSHKPLPFD